MFDATQYATLRAVVDCMIPADEAPGGLMAGVDRYLIRFLQHDGVGFVAQYQSALTALQHEAELRHDTGFAHLTPAQATDLLHALERNEIQAVWLTSPSAFVALMAEHCAEGFYADPRQGGNANGVSWVSIGFEERR
jgi:hypothetical protein